MKKLSFFALMLPIIGFMMFSTGINAQYVPLTDKSPTLQYLEDQGFPIEGVFERVENITETGYQPTVDSTVWIDQVAQQRDVLLPTLAKMLPINYLEDVMDLVLNCSCCCDSTDFTFNEECPGYYSVWWNPPGSNLVPGDYITLLTVQLEVGGVIISQWSGVPVSNDWIQFLFGYFNTIPGGTAVQLHFETETYMGNGSSCTVEGITPGQNPNVALNCINIGANWYLVGGGCEAEISWSGPFLVNNNGAHGISIEVTKDGQPFYNDENIGQNATGTLTELTSGHYEVSFYAPSSCADTLFCSEVLVSDIYTAPPTIIPPQSCAPDTVIYWDCKAKMMKTVVAPSTICANGETVEIQYSFDGGPWQTVVEGQVITEPNLALNSDHFYSFKYTMPGAQTAYCNHEFNVGEPEFTAEYWFGSNLTTIVKCEGTGAKIGYMKLLGNGYCPITAPQTFEIEFSHDGETFYQNSHSYNGTGTLFWTGEVPNFKDTVTGTWTLIWPNGVQADTTIQFVVNPVPEINCNANGESGGAYGDCGLQFNAPAFTICGDQDSTVSFNLDLYKDNQPWQSFPMGQNDTVTLLNVPDGSYTWLFDVYHMDTLYSEWDCQAGMTVVIDCDPCDDDVVAPVISLTPPPGPYVCEVDLNDVEVAAIDDCDPNPTITASVTGTLGPGEYWVEYTATDASGNSSSYTWYVEVAECDPCDNDNVPPYLEIHPPDTIPVCTWNTTSLMYEYGDNVGMANPPVVINPSAVLDPGSYVVTVTAYDICGNQTAKVFPITVAPCIIDTCGDFETIDTLIINSPNCGPHCVCMNYWGCDGEWIALYNDGVQVYMDISPVDTGCIQMVLDPGVYDFEVVWQDNQGNQFTDAIHVEITCPEETYTICGVIEDVDCDGNNGGFEGAFVYLYNSTGLLAETTTGPDGSYSFEGLPVDDYVVVVEGGPVVDPELTTLQRWLVHCLCQNCACLPFWVGADANMDWHSTGDPWIFIDDSLSNRVILHYDPYLPFYGHHYFFTGWDFGLQVPGNEVSVHLVDEDVCSVDFSHVNGNNLMDLLPQNFELPFAPPSEEEMLAMMDPGNKLQVIGNPASGSFHVKHASADFYEVYFSGEVLRLHNTGEITAINTPYKTSGWLVVVAKNNFGKIVGTSIVPFLH